MRRGGIGVAVSFLVGAGVGDGEAGAIVPVGEGGRLVGARVVNASCASDANVDWRSWVPPRNWLLTV